MAILIRNLKGYNGDYTISISGQIKDNKGKVIPQTLSNSGYFFVNLIKNGKPLNKRVDKLVATNYIHNPDLIKYTHVIALDHNKKNMLESNLKWVTEEYYNAWQKKPAIEAKIKAEKKSTRTSKGLVVTDTHSKKETKYNSPKEASQDLGITPQKIRAALRKGAKINNLTFKYS